MPCPEHLEVSSTEQCVLSPFDTVEDIHHESCPDPILGMCCLRCLLLFADQQSIRWLGHCPVHCVHGLGVCGRRVAPAGSP
jgi:hypothetical protein